jgi:hypothetical protein
MTGRKKVNIKIYFGKRMYNEVKVADWLSPAIPKDFLILETDCTSAEESDFTPANNLGEPGIGKLALSINGTIYGICGIAVDNDSLVLCAF